VGELDLLAKVEATLCRAGQQIPGLASAWSSSMKRRLTINRITSRGVKCSPAVSFESSEKRRISSSYR
jgi:hypothetical protein